MRTGTQIFQLLAGKDINGDEMHFGVSMLASLGGAHFHNLARAAFDHDVSIFAQGGALHGIGGGGAGVGGFECVFMLFV